VKKTGRESQKGNGRGGSSGETTKRIVGSAWKEVAKMKNERKNKKNTRRGLDADINEGVLRRKASRSRDEERRAIGWG